MRHTRHNRSKGFTLIELSFVITIFAIMASIVLFRFKDFGSKTALDNLAQDIALEIVQAQKQAISGVLSTGTSGASAPIYGVYFMNGSASAADAASKQFIYFTDINGDRVYNPPAGGCTGSGASGECLSTTAITTGEYVSNICALHSGTFSCLTAPGTAANITFKRPFPDATLYTCPAASCSAPTSNSRLFIEIASGTVATQKETIVVTQLGETSVFQGCAAMANNPSATCP